MVAKSRVRKTKKVAKRKTKRVVKRKPARKAKRPVRKAKPKIRKSKAKPMAKKAAKKPVRKAKPKAPKLVKTAKQFPVPTDIPTVKSDFGVKVENVVAFVSLGKPIPLTKLVNAVENAEYEPEQFPGLVYRTTEPRAAALIFSSGKIVCTGAKSIEKAHEAIAKVVAKIRESGIPMPRKYNVKVENIVASSKIHAKLNLEEITFSLENAEYEPEQFPGLVYRISEPRVAFLLFNSGKIICTGAHNIDDIHTALNKLKNKLESIGIKVAPAKD